MSLEGRVCQAEGVMGRKEVEKGVSDGCMGGGPGGQQGHGMPRGLRGGPPWPLQLEAWLGWALNGGQRSDPKVERPVGLYTGETLDQV